MNKRKFHVWQYVRVIESGKKGYIDGFVDREKYYILDETGEHIGNYKEEELESAEEERGLAPKSE